MIASGLFEMRGFDLEKLQLMLVMWFIYTQNYDHETNRASNVNKSTKIT